MPKFLFWNVGRKLIADLIISLALENDVDVLILAECQLEPNRLLQGLNGRAVAYDYAPGLCESLLFFTRFDSTFLIPVFESDRISIRQLKLPAREEMLVVGAHLPSKLHFSSDSQAFQCSELARQIEFEEAKVGHKRTIILGDLNVNPFEIGMVASSGLHAVSTRHVAEKGSRVVQGTSFSFFYNPMWSIFGDRHGNVPGTFYYEKAESVNYFWNIFDQILIRPELLEGFDNDGVRVITEVENRSLVDKRGTPDSKNASDHLPILLALEF